MCVRCVMQYPNKSISHPTPLTSLKVHCFWPRTHQGQENTSTLRILIEIHLFVCLFVRERLLVRFARHLDETRVVHGYFVTTTKNKGSWSDMKLKGQTNAFLGLVQCLRVFLGVLNLFRPHTLGLNPKSDMDHFSTDTVTNRGIVLHC